MRSLVTPVAPLCAETQVAVPASVKAKVRHTAAALELNTLIKLFLTSALTKRYHQRSWPGNEPSTNEKVNAVFSWARMKELSILGK
jgi:hypothetical protein